MKIEIIGTGMGPILSNKKLDELFFGTSTINKKSPLEEAMDKLLDEVKREDEKKYKAPICFDIQSITANHKKNAFTVVWGDGSHTMIHLQPGDVWDDEKALAMCFVKHMMGDTSSFNDIFTENMPAKIKHICKVEPVEEKDCECSGRREEGIHSCKNCSCHAEAEKAAEASVDAVLTKMGKSAEKVNVAMKKLIDELTSYPIFIKTSSAIVPAGHCNTIKGVKERVRELATDELGHEPYYYRTWMEDDFLFIDFGSHSKFIVIKGLTTDDWIKA